MLHAFILAAYARPPVPVWSWPTAEVRFHLETRLTTPRGTRYYAMANDDGVAAQVHVAADVVCLAEPDGRTVWAIVCTPERLVIDGVPLRGTTQPELDVVLEDWEQRLAGASYTMRQGRDGRMRQFDVTGLSWSDIRGARVVEAQRVLMGRVFAPFDLALSTDPDAWIRGWEEKSLSLGWQLPTQYGTVGAAALRVMPGPLTADLPSLRFAGRASVAIGVTMDDVTGAYNATDRRSSTAMSTAFLSGSALFNPVAGVPEWRDMIMEVHRNVPDSGAGDGSELLQVSGLQRVDAFAADGSAPLSVAALRAPMLSGTPSPVAEGVPLVPFAELGMNALYLPSIPREAQSLALDHTQVRARVWVGADGRVTNATAFEGFEVLAWPVEQALRGARFTARPEGAYAVDVEVDVRSGGH